MAFKFNVGSTYETLDGQMVRVIGRSGKYKGYETLVCSDGKYRYDRSTHSLDAGRTTGSPDDCLHNFIKFWETPK